MVEPVPSERMGGTIPLVSGATSGGQFVAVEIKRKAGIDAVEQLARYLDCMNEDPMLRPVRGILAATSITPQAQVLAERRGIKCVTVDYDELRGVERAQTALF